MENRRKTSFNQFILLIRDLLNMMKDLPVIGFLSYLCNQDAESHEIITNMQRFFNQF